MNDREFYEECASLLNCEHHGEPFKYHKRTRWNNRIAGQGRFIGCGIIRCFGSDVHMALVAPVTVTKRFPNKDAALEYLRELSTA